MTCRDAILAAIRRHAPDATFAADDVIRWMAGATYAESTIRTHVVSRMCREAPDNHGTVYDDLERVERGIYRMKRTSG
jgi:hypothetical protein